MASISDTSVLLDPVLHRLRALRRSVVTWLLLDGLAAVLLTVLILVVVDLGIDRFFRMDRAQRGVCLAIMGVILAVVIYRRLIRPLARPISDDMLALQVESSHRQLGQSFISALQFARIENEVAALGLSPVLVRATIEQGAREGANVDFSAVLDRGRFMRNVLLSLGIVVLLAGAAVAYPDAAQTWFNRNVLLGNLRWPQDTHLQFVQEIFQDENDKYYLTLPRGDDLKIEVEVESGVVPATVMFHDWTATRRGEQPMSARDESRAGQRVAREESNKPRFEYTLKNVLEEISFQARGGDGDTPIVAVRLVDRPTVKSMTLQLIPPAYTGRPPAALEPGQGPYEAYLGSRLLLDAIATKPLSEAKIRIVRKTKLADDVPAQIDAADRTRFRAALEPDHVQAAVYEIHVSDAEGRPSKRPETFTIKITPDRAPTVGAKLVGISSMVVAGAKVPVACSLSDDFAITAAALGYRIKSADDPAGVAAELAKVPFTELRTRYGQPKIEYTHELELNQLPISVGKDIEFIVEATDNDAISSPKTSQSQRFQVRVVTEEELRADLLRREREQRRQFEELLTIQQDLLTDTRAVEAGLTGRSQATADDRANLLKSQKRQSQAVERCKMIAGVLTQLVIEVENNRLEGPDGRYQRTMRDKIIGPLGVLAEKSIPEAARLLDEARRATDGEVVSRNKKLADAVAAELKVAEEMREILRHMVKSEGFQEAVNMLHRILDLQVGVSDETRKKLDELFRGRNDKKEVPKK
jgi:hypothetical protein